MQLRMTRIIKNDKSTIRTEAWRKVNFKNLT